MSPSRLLIRQLCSKLHTRSKPIPIKNTQVEGGGMGLHHVRGALEKCKKNGVQFVNFGPIKSDMIDEVNSEWYANRPNTDAVSYTHLTLPTNREV